jgi:hypothetical protein
MRKVVILRGVFSEAESPSFFSGAEMQPRDITTTIASMAMNIIFFKCNHLRQTLPFQWRMIGIKQFPAIGIYFPEKDNFSELPYNCIWILKGKDVQEIERKLS